MSSNENLTFLKSHILFRRLQDNEIQDLNRLSLTFEAEEGSVPLYQRDRLDSIYLLVEGEAEAVYQNENGSVLNKRKLFPGDLIGEQVLKEPLISEFTLKCRSRCRLLLIPGHRFRIFLRRSPGIIERLSPIFDEFGRQTGGLPRELWEELRKLSPQEVSGEERGQTLYYKGRMSRIRLLMEFFPFLLIGGFSTIAVIRLHLELPVFWPGMPPLLCWFLIACAAVGLLWRFIRWLSEQYIITSDYIFKRVFRLRGLSIENMQIPFDQVQSTNAAIKHIWNKALDIGSVHIKNAAASGTITFRNIDHPGKVAAQILALKEERDRLKQSSQQMEIRQALEKWFGTSNGLRLLAGQSDEELGLPADENTPEGTIFRKSRFVLFRKIWIPVLIQLTATSLMLIFRGILPWPVLASGGGVLLILACYVLWHYIDWKNDLFKVEGGYVWDIDRKPLGRSENRNQIEIASAQNIQTVQNGIFAFLFNFGDVLIITPGGVSDVKFESVSNPVWVQSVLIRLRDAWQRQQKEQDSRERVQDILAVADVVIQAQEQGRIPNRTPE